MKGVMPIAHTSLVFLTNELLSPVKQKVLNIPLEFVSFGLMCGSMYSSHWNQSTFIMDNVQKRPWGNTVVYGAIFLLRDFDFYIQALDAYQGCSLSVLRRNHQLDYQHRHIKKITPIYFSNLKQFSHLLYQEGTQVEAHVYTGNPKHNKITQRLQCNNPSHRIVDGIDLQHFKSLVWEETH